MKKTTMRPAEAARLLGVSKQNIAKRMLSVGISPQPDGSYTTADVARAIALTVDTDDEAKTLSIAIKREQLRRAQLQSELLELEIAREKKQIVTVSEHRAILRTLQQTCIQLFDLWTETICARRRDPTLEADLHAARLDALKKLDLIDDDEKNKSR